MTNKTKVSLAVLTSVFVLVAIFTVSGQFSAFNRIIANAVYSLETPSLTLIFKTISNISEWYVYVPITILLVAIPKLRWKFGIPVLVTLAVSASLNELLKLCFAVPRPDEHRLIAVSGLSFPSGHAMNGAAFIGICTLLLLRYSAKQPLRIAASILAVLFVLSVGFSRVYLGVHNATDVIAGYAMGLILCLCTNIVIDRHKEKRQT